MNIHAELIVLDALVEGCIVLWKNNNSPFRVPHYSDNNVHRGGA